MHCSRSSCCRLRPLAADYPAPKQGQWIARDFKFHTGEVMPEVPLAYTTIGEPSGEPVLVLHGTSQRAAAMLTPVFAGELFGAGQPLDASKYFIIIPDSLGHGGSTKPSDGLRGKFPRYNYDDMVEAQYRLVTEGLGIKRVRLIIGNSMGGMHAWLWGTKYPEFMDALAPMASQPTAMAARNWMLRRLMIETIRRDPDYANGDYKTQPQSMKIAMRVLCDGHQRRHARVSEARADRCAGRQIRRGAARRVIHRRRERFSLRMGIVQGLRPRTEP